MVWKVLELSGHVMFFKIETLPTPERVRARTLIEQLAKLDDPKSHPNIVKCKDAFRCVAQINDSTLLLAFTVHDDNDKDENLRHSIELVDIIDERVL